MKRLQLGRAVLFICDIQEKFRPLIFNFSTVLSKSNLLNETAKILSMPRIVTEQYPKAFGPTVSEISTTPSISSPVHLFPKKQFSMMIPEVITTLGSYEEHSQVIICGIEAHACVLQTVLDLLQMNKEVFVVCDSVSSQRPHDRLIALDRMKESGATLITSESAIFELIRGAEHPSFRQISSLLKTNLESSPNEFSELPHF